MAAGRGRTAYPVATSWWVAHHRPLLPEHEVLGCRRDRCVHLADRKAERNEREGEEKERRRDGEGEEKGGVRRKGAGWGEGGWVDRRRKEGGAMRRGEGNFEQ